MKPLVIEEKSITIRIDAEKCGDCKTKACIGACRTYGRGMLALADGVPSVAHLSQEEVLRLGSECLACEFACQFDGKGAIHIDIPIKGLDEYLSRRGLTSLIGSK